MSTVYHLGSLPHQRYLNARAARLPGDQ